MSGPKSITPGGRPIPKTISLHVLKRALEDITRTLKLFRGPGHLFIKVTPLNIEILPTRRKNETSILLTISEYSHVADNFRSPASEHILSMRGYHSVFIASKLERPDPVDPALLKYMSDIVLEANRAILISITNELQTPRLIVWSAENAAWHESTRQWAAIYDPQGEVVRFLPNGNVMIMNPNPRDLEILKRTFKLISGDFRREQPLKVGSRLAFAPTAFHDTVKGD